MIRNSVKLLSYIIMDFIAQFLYIDGYLDECCTSIANDYERHAGLRIE